MLECLPMKKDFRQWNKLKQRIHETNRHLFYREGEVWWCSLGLNIGFEEDGKGREFTRPVLIIKGFSRQVCLCVPLTSKLKIGKYYHPISLDGTITKRAILSQIRLIDTKRLLRRIGVVDEETFKQIKKAIIQLLE